MRGTTILSLLPGVGQVMLAPTLGGIRPLQSCNGSVLPVRGCTGHSMIRQSTVCCTPPRFMIWEGTRFKAADFLSLGLIR